MFSALDPVRLSRRVGCTLIAALLTACVGCAAPPSRPIPDPTAAEAAVVGAHSLWVYRSLPDPGMPQNEVRLRYMTRNGELWVALRTTLYRRSVKGDWERTAYTRRTHTQPPALRLATRLFFRRYVDRSQDLGISAIREAEDGTIYVFDGLEIHRLQDGVWQRVANEPSDTVTMAVDAAGNPWRQSAHRIEAFVGNEWHTKLDLPAKSELLNKPAFFGNLIRDAQGAIWCGGNLDAEIRGTPHLLYRFTPDGLQTWDRLGETVCQSATVEAIDAQGRLWLTTDRGRRRFDPATGVALGDCPLLLGRAPDGIWARPLEVLRHLQMKAARGVMPTDLETKFLEACSPGGFMGIPGRETLAAADAVLREACPNGIPDEVDALKIWPEDAEAFVPSCILPQKPRPGTLQATRLDTLRRTIPQSQVVDNAGRLWISLGDDLFCLADDRFIWVRREKITGGHAAFNPGYPSAVFCSPDASEMWLVQSQGQIEYLQRIPPTAPQTPPQP